MVCHLCSVSVGLKCRSVHEITIIETFLSKGFELFYSTVGTSYQTSTGTSTNTYTIPGILAY